MMEKYCFFIFLYIVCAANAVNIVQSPMKSSPSQCQSIPPNDRLDCFPQKNANQQDCEARGCCWLVPQTLDDLPNVPYCFYQPKTPSYTFKNITESSDGVIAYLERSNKSPYPRDITTLKFVATYHSDLILEIKVIDASSKRFESFFPEIDLPAPSAKNPNYKLSINDDSQGFKIIRIQDNAVLFDASDFANFIYSDQFLQITTKLPSKNIYGLGEQRKRFKVSTNWKQITLFNHDMSPTDNANIYGTHPFYLLIENSTKAHGVFLKNSNGLEIILQDTPALTFRSIGGILDFYFFLGPTPAEVLKQYQEVIGKPKMPPYWSLGFHLCRWGVGNLENTKALLERNLNVGVPVETQWHDLDYMHNNNDFTYNPDAFAGLPEYVNGLHKQGRRYVILIDPGISGSEVSGSYPPYDRGVELDIFVKNSTGQIFVGKVWNPVSTVFPDFTHPNAYTYWKEMLENFHNKIPFDGAWIDMNEPSNSAWPYGCPESELETPPYQPNVNEGALFKKTFCMTAKQYAGVHYDVHNLYGISEANITSRALSEILGERSLVITRSSFPGHGRYGGHWGGDVFSTWDDLRYSIPHLLDFSLFGIPLMGSDICGFNGDATEDLCNRWLQLGAFYPFSRTHNSINNIDQDPAAMGEQVIRSTVKALKIRYSLLPYLYTLFWQANQEGSTVARPLVIEFPEDPNTYDIDTSFLWGSGLLIAPVLENDPPSISVYLPKGIWYDFYTRTPFKSSGDTFNIKTDKDTIPLFIRGGQVITTQFEADTTEEVRTSRLRIIAALDENHRATGKFYWDDGLSIDVGEDYTVLEYHFNNGTVHIEAIHLGKTPVPKIFSIEVLSLPTEVKHIEHPYNEILKFSYNKTNKVLLMENVNIDTYPVRIICH